MKRWLARGLLVSGCLLVLAGIAYWGLIRYLEWREADSPSTVQVLVTPSGERIPFFSSAPLNAQVNISDLSDDSGQKAALQTGLVSTTDSSGTADTGSDISRQVQPPTREAFYPPTRILIPSLGIDRPVVLSTDNHMPKFQGVGWFLGSAYPGHSGNMVLFGHLDGPYATLGNLKHLEIGSIFQVSTSNGVSDYRVTSKYETLRTDVRVMEQNRTGATATLITCSGTWSSTLQDYSHRLIVKGVLIDN